MKKFKLTKNKIKAYGRELYQIKALKDFNDVKKGDLGGYIEVEANLSHDGDCWVYDFASARDNARLLDNSTMKDCAAISNNVMLLNNATMADYTIASGCLVIANDTKLLGNATITSYLQ